jgi:hypothetical protein
VPRSAALPFVLFALLAASSAAAQLDAAAAPAPAPTAPVLLLPTHAIAVDDAVKPFVDRALRGQAESLGYTLADPQPALTALQTRGGAYPPSMLELQRTAADSGVRYAAVAVIWASNGRYAIQIRVAPAQGTPTVTQAEVSNLELETVAARLLAQQLPAASANVPMPLPLPMPESASASASASESESESEAASAPAPTPSGSRLRLALHNASSFGLADDPFFVDAFGVRVDFRVDRAFWLGVYAGYANLPSRDGRADGFLTYGQAEQRIALGAGRGLAVPLRVALGYLARNGGFLRVASGLAIPLGARSELAFELLAPTFWATPDKVLFSLDAGVELAFTP